MDKRDSGYEEVRVRGVDLAPRVSDLLHQSNVRRVIIRDGENTLLEIPVTMATATTSAASVLTAVGALGATTPDFNVVVVRTEQARRAEAARAATSHTGATEDQMNTQQMVAQRIDNRGTRIEDLAGTGEHDSSGG